MSHSSDAAWHSSRERFRQFAPPYGCGCGGGGDEANVRIVVNVVSYRGAEGRSAGVVLMFDLRDKEPAARVYGESTSTTRTQLQPPQESGSLSVWLPQVIVRSSLALSVALVCSRGLFSLVSVSLLAPPTHSERSLFRTQQLVGSLFRTHANIRLPPACSADNPSANEENCARPCLYAKVRQAPHN